MWDLNMQLCSMSLQGLKGGGDGWEELDLLYAQLQDTAQRVGQLQVEWMQGNYYWITTIHPITSI